MICEVLREDVLRRLEFGVPNFLLGEYLIKGTKWLAEKSSTLPERSQNKI